MKLPKEKSKTELRKVRSNTQTQPITSCTALQKLWQLNFPQTQPANVLVLEMPLCCSTLIRVSRVRWRSQKSLWLCTGWGLCPRFGCGALRPRDRMKETWNKPGVVSERAGVDFTPGSLRLEVIGLICTRNDLAWGCCPAGRVSPLQAAVPLGLAGESKWSGRGRLCQQLCPGLTWVRTCFFRHQRGKLKRTLGLP